MNEIEKLKQMGLLEQMEKFNQLEQSEQISLNDILTMQLTLDGIKAVKEYYAMIRPRANANIGEPKINSIGIFECSLEEFIEIFGKEINLEGCFEQIYITKNEQMQRIDLKDPLTIKLTLDGVEAVKEYYNEIGRYANGVKSPKFDSIGMFECEFQELVQTFSEQISLEDCFEKIYITKNEEKAKSR